MVASGFNKNVETALRNLLLTCEEIVIKNVDSGKDPISTLDIELGEIEDYKGINVTFEGSNREILDYFLGILRNHYRNARKEVQSGLDLHDALKKATNDLMDYIWGVEERYKERS